MAESGVAVAELELAVGPEELNKGHHPQSTPVYTQAADQEVHVTGSQAS